MKKFLLPFVALIFVFNYSTAQYQKLLNDDSQWHTYHWFEAGHSNIDYLDGDTTVANVQYKKHVYSIYGSPSDSYTALLREDTISKKIYRLTSVNSEEIIYDFSLLPGDTFFYQQHILVLDSITETLISDLGTFDPGNPLLTISNPKIFYFSTSESIYSVVWIEGIGSLAGLILNYHPWAGGELGETLLCHFDENGERDFLYIFSVFGTATECSGGMVGFENIPETSVNISISPNPTNHELNINLENKHADTSFNLQTIKIYTQFGKLVSIHKTNSNNVLLDISNHPKGLLFVSIELNNKAKLIQKIIKI